MLCIKIFIVLRIVARVQLDHNPCFTQINILRSLSAIDIVSGGETPFLYCINHNTNSFYEKNAKAAVLRQVFEWFVKKFEAIYPDQPIGDKALLDGSSILSNFDEKQVRIDKVMDENYLAGHLGGLPVL